MKPEIFSAIMEHFASGDPILLPAQDSDSMASDGSDAVHPHQIHPDDSETVQMIKELLETRFVEKPAQEECSDNDHDYVCVIFDALHFISAVKFHGLLMKHNHMSG